MLVGASLIVMVIIVLLNLVMGNDFLGNIASLGVENEAIIDGIPTTFVVDSANILFTIDTTSIVGALTILTITLIATAFIVGITVVGSGLNATSGKIIMMITVFAGIWGLLSYLAYSLIISINIFGPVIYVSITIAYVVGVSQMLAGGGGND